MPLPQQVKVPLDLADVEALTTQLHKVDCQPNSRNVDSWDEGHHRTDRGRAVRILEGLAADSGRHLCPLDYLTEVAS